MQHVCNCVIAQRVAPLMEQMCYRSLKE